MYDPGVSNSSSYMYMYMYQYNVQCVINGSIGINSNQERNRIQARVITRQVDLYQ